jgi:malonate-semialdehyde dehydrogenase (acetylating)/methylmalonate-semialdehyde dehydrogenase
VLLDGRNYINPEFPNGNFFGPTLVDVPKKSRWSVPAYKNELFGPVLSLIRVDSYEEGLEVINDNGFGNGVCIFTHSGFYARDFIDRMEPGQIGVNVPIPVPLPMFSFSGNKGSFC